MARSVSQHAIEIEAIILYKFGSLISGIPAVPDKVNSLDITPQVQEVNLFESVFSPVLRAELAVIDYIGLQVNFPLSGEEAVAIQYRNVFDESRYTLYFIINDITHITASDDGRSTGYMINCIAIEAYANALQTVQQAYEDTVPNIAKNIFEEHIVRRLQRVFPQYISQPLITENTDSVSGIVVIPNIRPFAAMTMLADMAVPDNLRRHTYLFYQNRSSFNFVTLQGMFDFSARGGGQRNFAERHKYMYMSNQIEDEQVSTLNNEGRVISRLVFNKRQSSFQKLMLGYYHNNLFEINIAQKDYWGTHSRADEATTIYNHLLNTDTYTQLAQIEGGDDDERSNRTKYIVTTQKEYDKQFPVSRYRDKWGRDLIATTAMAQVDLTVTVPGTSRFKAGDLFYLEIPEMHGFNELEMDDLVSGLFVITEIKHILVLGGYHTTVMRINKDSYMSSIDRRSRYATGT